jgi:membrane-associated phospholipid phosphatase
MKLTSRSCDTSLAAPAAWRSGILPDEVRTLRCWLIQIQHACGAFEWLTLGYLSLLNTLILVFHGNLPHAWQYIFIHQSLAASILALAWAAARGRNEYLRFARHWYPLALYVFLFEELGRLVHLVFQGWFDRWMIQFDYALVGVHPSVWLAHFASPALNDFMQAAYMTYFAYLIVLPAALYARGERKAFWEVMTSTAAAQYAIYLISVLLPIESPYYSLAALQHVSLSGGFSTSLINWIERYGRVHGAAFPSAHVAGSMVAMMASWRYRRRLFWVCLPFFASMMVATVYGRYHYIADVLAGLATGALGFAAGHRLMKRPHALPELSKQESIHRSPGPEDPGIALAVSAPEDRSACFQKIFS